MPRKPAPYQPPPADELERAAAEHAALLEAIAVRHARVETLEERKMDALDFPEVSVWGLKDALAAAYLAGRASAGA